MNVSQIKKKRNDLIVSGFLEGKKTGVPVGF